MSLDELCEAERRALQEVALIKLNRMDFNIPSNLVKGECLANSGGLVRCPVDVVKSPLYGHEQAWTFA